MTLPVYTCACVALCRRNLCLSIERLIVHQVDRPVLMRLPRPDRVAPIS